MSRQSGSGKRESGVQGDAAGAIDGRADVGRCVTETRDVPDEDSRPSGAHATGAAGDPMRDSDVAATALSRREAIALTAAAIALPALDWTDAQAQRAAQLVRRSVPAVAAQAPTFFTTDEWEIVRLLVDYVIPKDEKSGSATDAGVPEFMDHMMSDPEASPSSRVAMRGGLAWLDTESRRRYGTGFVAATDAQRRVILDDIAWPKRARPDLSHGVSFFNRFRDLTASGFFSSAIGYADLEFRGNTFVTEWTGCPPEALRKLGVKY